MAANNVVFVLGEKDVAGIVGARNIVEMVAPKNMIEIKNITEAVMSKNTTDVTGNQRRLSEGFSLGPHRQLNTLPDFVWQQSAKQMQWLIGV